ncbi:MAG: polysaccharide pyruvyl transferase family protein [Spirochaetia bacterium]|nr:polysaccharide pyruvyl transferase family protein [Spirochaetia bacterium]
MKRIGIMTWWRNYNYGATLQALALQQTLTNLGYQVELIDYWRERCNIDILQYISNVRNWITSGFLFKTVLRLVRTRRFLNKYCKSSNHIKSYEELCTTSKYDIIIVGSDQVWNPLWFDKNRSYLLEHLSPTITRVAYAVSIAENDITPWRDIFKSALESFKFVSIRENTQIPQLKDISNKEIEWVVDPTQLLTQDDWIKFLDLKASQNSSDIIAYWISEDESLISDTIRIAHVLKKRIAIYTNATSFRFRFEFSKPISSIHNLIKHFMLYSKLRLSPYIEYKKDADAKMFLSALLKANNIVTDSFHGLMFSIIMNKNTKIYIPDSGRHMSSRIVDFLSRINGRNYVIHNITGEIFNEHSSFDIKLLRAWVEKSYEWLVNSLTK